MQYKYTVNAGIKDLTQATYEANGNTIIVELPKVEILNNESDIGSYEIIETSQNPLNQLNGGEINDLLKLLKETAIQRSIEEGILVKAKNYTEELLKEKFKDILVDKYDIDVHWQ